MKIIHIITEGAVEDLEKDLNHPYSYDAIDHMMTTIAKKHGITPKELHDLFVEKHKVVPDEWANPKEKKTEESVKFTDMEIALMEGGHSLNTEKFTFIKGLK